MIDFDSVERMLLHPIRLSLILMVVTNVAASAGDGRKVKLPQKKLDANAAVLIAVAITTVDEVVVAATSARRIFVFLLVLLLANNIIIMSVVVIKIQRSI